jgi:hypothetical protein
VLFRAFGATRRPKVRLDDPFNPNLRMARGEFMEALGTANCPARVSSGVLMACVWFFVCACAVRLAMRKYEDKERWAGHRLLRLLRKVRSLAPPTWPMHRPDSHLWAWPLTMCVSAQHIVRFAFDKRAFVFGRELESDACKAVLGKAE